MFSRLTFHSSGSRCYRRYRWLSITTVRPTRPRAPPAGSPAPFSGRRRSSDHLARTVACTDNHSLPTRHERCRQARLLGAFSFSHTVATSSGRTLGRFATSGSRCRDMQGKRALVANGRSHQFDTARRSKRGEPSAPRNGPESMSRWLQHPVEGPCSLPLLCC